MLNTGNYEQITAQVTSNVPKLSKLKDINFNIKNNSSSIIGEKGFANSKFGQGLNKNSGLIGGAIGVLDQVIPSLDKDINENDAQMKNIRSKANKMLISSGNPFAMAAGAINMAIDKTGGFTDASQGLGKGTDFGNKAAALALPGFGWAVGRTKKIYDTDVYKELGGYGGSADKYKTASQNANAKLLFGKKKANNMIGIANVTAKTVEGIKDYNDLVRLRASNTTNLSSTIDTRLRGGNNQIAVGKQGMKIPSKSIIAGGALHEKEHNITSIMGEDDIEITTKGIPVVTEDLEQVAEIENGELVLQLSITEQLEALYKENSEEAMIKAGKILSKEIVKNTIDNTCL